MSASFSSREIGSPVKCAPGSRPPSCPSTTGRRPLGLLGHRGLAWWSTASRRGAAAPGCSACGEPAGAVRRAAAAAIGGLRLRDGARLVHDLDRRRRGSAAPLEARRGRLGLGGEPPQPAAGAGSGTGAACAGAGAGSASQGGRRRAAGPPGAASATSAVGTAAARPRPAPRPPAARAPCGRRLQRVRHGLVEVDDHPHDRHRGGRVLRHPHALDARRLPPGAPGGSPG